MNKYVNDADLKAHDNKVVEQLKKRKLVNVISLKYYKVTKGDNFQAVRVKLETDLTTDMLRSGTWKEAKFKKYNFNAQGLPSDGGHLHPLLKVRA